ncbi:phosphopantothenoylcysteine decarboxylase domain-containing protein, partial [Brevibacterium paucivorans]
TTTAPVVVAPAMHTEMWFNPATVDNVAVLREVETTAQLESVCREQAAEADIVIMAAAVSDYRPAQTAGHKMKKDGDAGLTIELVQNPDILAGLVADRRDGQT